MRSTVLVVAALVSLAVPACAQNYQLISILRGAVIIGQDSQHTHLGTITNAYDSDSVFNEYGIYGNKYASDAIWNSYGTFGNPYSTYSPFNAFTTTPPMIIKDGEIIGYLTTNKAIRGGLYPAVLKSMAKSF